MMRQVHAEGHGGVEGEGRVLADVVVAGGVPISTVPFCTASSTWSGGTISPPAKTRTWNFWSVISARRWAKYSAPPKTVSRLLGQLVAMRQLIVGEDCAIAGAAMVLAANPAPPADKNLRRFHGWILPGLIFALAPVFAVRPNLPAIIHDQGPSPRPNSRARRRPMRAEKAGVSGLRLRRPAECYRSRGFLVIGGMSD